MKKHINVKKLCTVGFLLLLAAAMLCVPAAAATTTTTTTTNAFSNAVLPIVSLLNQIVGPALALVGAIGTLYCVLLGVKFAKAEEPQEREKAKSHLKNAIIGFVLIFVLIAALNITLKPLTEWAAKQAGITITIPK